MMNDFRRRLTRALLLAGGSALAVPHAMAQQAAAPTDGAAAAAVTLETVVLTATTDASVQAQGYVGTQAQAATKSDTPVAEAQQSVSVITVDQARDQGARTLGEALSYSAGVAPQPYGGDLRFDNPVVRGFDGARAQYVNGLRQGRYFGGVAYELYGMQQVEVVRGPASALYGSGSPAGIVNQVQKRAQDHDFGEAGIGYGSHGSNRLFFDVNKARSDRLATRLTGIVSDTRQQIDDVDNERRYLAGALRWSPGEATTVDVLLSYTRDSPITPVGVPYGLAQADDGKDLRKVNLAMPGWDESDREMWSLGVETSHEFANGWKLQQGFRYESLNWAYQGSYVSTGLADDGAILRGISKQDEESRTISLDTRLAGELTAGAMVHRLLFGLDLKHHEVDEKSQISGTLPISRADIGARTAMPDLPAPSRTDATLKETGLYAQDEIEAGPWRGTLALRYDRAEQTGEQYGIAAAYDEEAVTGRASIGYRTAQGVMPYLSLATGFEPQTGLTTGKQALKPLRSRQVEVGVKYEPAAFPGLLTAAVYDLRQKNVAQWAGYDAGSNAYLYNDIGEVRSRGLELEGTAEIGTAWKLKASYAYNDTEQLGGTNVGQPMPNAPRHLASLWADHDFGNGGAVGVGARHLGERADAANAHMLGGVTLLDMGASYERGRLAASVNVQNLTDKDYLATCSYFGCYYGEGRTIMAQVATRW